MHLFEKRDRVSNIALSSSKTVNELYKNSILITTVTVVNNLAIEEFKNPDSFKSAFLEVKTKIQVFDID